MAMEESQDKVVAAAVVALEENPRGRRKERIGLVVSDKMDKTITVAVYGFKIHQLYKKRVKHTRKFKAHDEKNECNVGDTVRISETRPLSKTKRWRLIEIVKRAE
jgi:small subunit ribosomal protein S17